MILNPCIFIFSQLTNSVVFFFSAVANLVVFIVQECRHVDADMNPILHLWDNHFVFTILYYAY